MSLSTTAAPFRAELEAGRLDDVGGQDRLKDLLHVIFGLSKDFCASGLRFGALHRCGTKVWVESVE